MSTSVSELDTFYREAYGQVFALAVDLWFEPEVRRRQALWKIPPGFSLTAAQAVIHEAGEPSKIGFNLEVMALAPWDASNSDSIIIEQSGANDPNACRIRLKRTERDGSHLTLASTGQHWYGSVNFQGQEKRAIELLAGAETRLECSTEAFATNGHRIAFCELAGAAAKVAEAHVITTRSPAKNADGLTHVMYELPQEWYLARGFVNTLRAIRKADSAQYSRGMQESVERVEEWQCQIVDLIVGAAENTGECRTQRCCFDVLIAAFVQYFLAMKLPKANAFGIGTEQA